MLSNTKLTKEQKMILKSLKEGSPHVKFINNCETTIAYVDRGHTVEFALSVMSPDEKRFRRKVGEYYALDRFYNSQTVKMRWWDFGNMCSEVFSTFE